MISTNDSRMGIRMKSKNLLYLTLSKHRIWYYQRWIPLHFRKHNPNLKNIFRVSLYTEKLSEAKIKSRILSVKIDELALLYFNTPNDFAEGMKLLFKLAQKKQKGELEYPEYEELLNLGLNENEEGVSNYYKATALNFDIFQEISRLNNELEYFKTQLQNSLSKNDYFEIIDRSNKEITSASDDNPYIIAVFDEWKKDNIETMGSSGYNKYESDIELFIKIITHEYNKVSEKKSKIRVADITTAHIRAYHNIIKNIPKNANIKNKDISQIVQLKCDTKTRRKTQTVN